MHYTPQQQNKTVSAIVISLIVFGIGVYLLPNVAHVRALFCQLVALVSLIAAVFLLVRYKTTSFTYSIRPRSRLTDDDRETAFAGELMPITHIQPKYLDFVVSKQEGRRGPSMECVLGLDSLVLALELRASAPDSKPEELRFRRVGEAVSFVREKYGAVSLYDYTVTLGLDQSLLLLFRDGERYAAIRVEPNAEMHDFLVNIVPKA